MLIAVSQKNVVEQISALMRGSLEGQIFSIVYISRSRNHF